MLNVHCRFAALILHRVREALDVLLYRRIIERSAYQPLDIIDGVRRVLSDLILGCLAHKLFPIFGERHPRWRDATSHIIG
mmetsp:Transcript_2728/g.6114  ORF Transcript_2728/g.6114 Transcript_2728/m.6114 type:complete len:80 (+) Transcript_2728:777-1016(+)